MPQRKRVKPLSKLAQDHRHNDSRGRRILNLLNISLKDQRKLEELSLPKYENTKGLQKEDISLLLNCNVSERVAESEKREFLSATGILEESSSSRVAEGLADVYTFEESSPIRTTGELPSTSMADLEINCNPVTSQCTENEHPLEESPASRVSEGLADVHTFEENSTIRTTGELPSTSMAGLEINCNPVTSQCTANEHNPETSHNNEQLSSDSSSSCSDDPDEDPEYIPDKKTTSPSTDSLQSEAEERACNQSGRVPNTVDIGSEEEDIFEHDIRTTNTNNEQDTVGLESGGAKKKRVREKDFCFFCEEWVTTFARHIVRNHQLEMEVQQIISKEIKSAERKDLIALLRKKGNYLACKTGTIRPVRKATLDRSISKPLPCTYCLGLYSRKQLWRHRRKCSKNPGVAGGKSAQSAGQSLLVKEFKVSQLLREKVFERMRADPISLVAQKDTLICAYGSRYLLTHRKDHQYNVCSRKMRELGRLLIAIRQLDPKIKDLIHALRPENFDLLVEASRIEAGYNKETDIYRAPTFGMNIGTSLKECCGIAITHAMKRKFCVEGKSATELETELRTTILLIESNWNVEVSHQASNCLSTNNMNKITIVPLASDLKSFRDFLISQGNTAVQSLTVDETNLSSFKTLTENVYCRVLLLCRKRVGELQRLPLALYQNAGSKSNYEEFKDTIRPSEIILIRKFKRVVIHGKRKVTPVLFSPDVQDHINILIKVRNNFVKESNPFLFANTTSDNPIVGYKVLTAQAKKAGVKTPEAFKSRLLRTHIATVSQLFSMSDQDIEQLSSFMGHTPGVHRREYRLPDDVFQTSKIAKLLLAMESGQGAKYKGKTLDEIEVDLDENIIEKQQNGSEESDDSDANPLDKMMLEEFPKASTSKNQDKQPIILQSKAKRELVKWEDNEKEVVADFFKNHIKNSRPPRKHECEQLINEHPQLLKNKTWLKIKVFVQNLYTKKTKLK